MFAGTLDLRLKPGSILRNVRLGLSRCAGSDSNDPD